MVRGPIFQQASTVEIDLHKLSGNVTLNVAHELPENFFLHEFANDVYSKMLSNDDFPIPTPRSALHNAMVRAPILLNNTG